MDAHRGDGKRFLALADEKANDFFRNLNTRFGNADSIDRRKLFPKFGGIKKDLNQADDFPPLGSSPVPGLQSLKLAIAGKGEEER